MGRFLRNVFVGIAVVAISAAIVFLLMRDQKAKEDVLHASLSLLGERLLAMVPAGEDKVALKERYEEFMQKADRQEVPPEKIELVAAEILNASTTEQTICPEDAELLLSFAVEEQAEAKCEGEELAKAKVCLDKVDTETEAAPHLEEPSVPPAADFVVLGQRLQDMVNVSMELKKAVQEDSLHRDLFVFHADSGLRLLADEKLRTRIELAKLRRKIGELEKKRMVMWSPDVRTEVRAARPRVEYAQRPFIHALLPPEARKELMKGLKTIDSLKVFGEDSLAAAVARSLEDAGLLPPRKEKPK